MAKWQRICAQLLLMAFSTVPHLALAQAFAPLPEAPTDSVAPNMSVATDRKPTHENAPPAVVDCPDCGGWHGWGRRCGLGVQHAFYSLPFQGGGFLKHSSYTGRDVGAGWPLRGTSWLNRPQYVGWFFGIMSGDELINGRVDQNTDLFGGYRIGWDLDHFWGAEARLGWTALNILDNQVPQRPRTSDVIVGDIAILYYPWGDARWRPYSFIGLGVSSFDFIDDVGRGHDTALFGLPIGIGMKYLSERRWLAFRAEIADNIAFSDSGINSMHNFAFTFGVEIHYGARPKTYWPWHPSRHIW